jgi:transcriptional regulator with XRE-family HTH domain
MSLEFDTQAFYAALDAQREAKGLSWRQAAKEIGVSSSTFSRLSQGKLPDVENFVAILNWLGLDARAFYTVEKQNNPETLTMISVALHNDPQLSREDATLIESLVRSTYEKLRSKHG